LALEITHLVLSCVGLGLDISEIVIRAVVKEVEALVREPAFQRAVEKFYMSLMVISILSG
jgi:hypothetical protein